MWNETLELHPARRLKEDNSIALESGLKLRPEIFDIRCSDHSPALFLLIERFSKLSDASDDVGSGRQRETSDVGVTLRRRGTELPHRT